MPNMFRMSLIMLAVFWLSACSTGAIDQISLFEKEDAAHDLSAGLKEYEDGNYSSAITLLQRALQEGLKRQANQVRAYKYMAFSYCVTGREKLCRESFKKALETDPDFDLKPAEAGHPIWGPVFRSVKSKPSA